nr:hypothetical protein [Thermoanaerobacterium sp. RBIITD]
MYLKKSKHSSGRIYLSIADGYRDKERGHTRTVTIKSLGYLDELQKQYDDPIAFFEQQVKELNKQKAMKKAPITLSFFPDEKF